MSQPPIKPPNPLALRDALRQASTDPAFARRLIEDPESLKEEYHLADDTIADIKRVAGELDDHALEAVAGGLVQPSGGGYE